MAHQDSLLDHARRLAGRVGRTIGLLVALGVVAALVFEATDPAPAAHHPRTDGWYLRQASAVDAELRGLFVHHSDGQRLWATRYDEVYVSDVRDGQQWRLVAVLGPAEEGLLGWLRHAVRSSRTARLLGGGRGVEGILVTGTGTVLAAYPPHVLRSTDGGATWGRVTALPGRPAGVRADTPFRDWGEDARGRIWLRGDRSLLRSDDDGATWGDAWGSPGGAIRLLRVDPIRGRPWVGLGSATSRPALGWIDEDGGFRPVSEGDPAHAASDLAFTGGEVFVVNALPRGPAGVWRYSRVHDTLERVAELGGPVLDVALLDDETVVLATAVAGIGERDCQLWYREVGDEFTQWGQVPMFVRPRGRAWGTIWFPGGDPLPDLRLTAERLGRVHRATLVARFR